MIYAMSDLRHHQLEASPAFSKYMVIYDESGGQGVTLTAAASGWVEGESVVRKPIKHFSPRRPLGKKLRRARG